ncbi:C13 family peptidase [Aestuariicoccus sp. MJ-SS9]|uniref:C13 family peptidase n=1 Tax=Aestuariicoccus sp. MJ-SS9 TaxID=3079855 RepID=UPI002913DEB1|nr:C13 family peptidase [Aestuariicoccus sp. MJ-SS9]MDU8909884.1 C13 family peptidase [Aestuariicoccus sp. MJ-SS9]
MQNVMFETLRNAAFPWRALFRRETAGFMTATPGQIVLAVLVALAAGVLFEAFLTGPGATPNRTGFFVYFGGWLLTALGLALGLTITGSGALLPAALLVTCWVSVFNCVVAILFWELFEYSEGMLQIAPGVGVVVLGFSLLGAGFWRVAREAGSRGWRALPGLVPVIAVSAAVQFEQATWPLFWEADPASASEEEASVWIETERLYAEQSGLLRAQTDALAPQRPGLVDVYAVTFGGYGFEKVFAYEAHAVAGILGDGLAGPERVVILANSAPDPLRTPMANHVNLERALAAIGARMNRDEDMAIVFLTSHGSPDNLSLEMPGGWLQDMSAGRLAAILDAADIPNLAIVVSACYSGSFVDDLEAPSRLVITASSAETNSFGCGDHEGWTWFGRAFWEEGVGASTDLRRAFEVARDTVTAWEEDAGHTPSRPQMSVGTEVAAHLDRLDSERQRQALAAE